MNPALLFMLTLIQYWWIFHWLTFYINPICSWLRCHKQVVLFCTCFAEWVIRPNFQLQFWHCSVNCIIVSTQQHKTDSYFVLINRVCNNAKESYCMIKITSTHYDLEILFKQATQINIREALNTLWIVTSHNRLQLVQCLYKAYNLRSLWAE